MTVGILTFHNTPNFGATLQCYALTKYIESLGEYVEVINYMPPRALFRYARSQFAGKRRSIRNIGKFARFRTFLEEHVTLSGPPVFDRSRLAQFDDGRYCAVFTGSDEVWKVDRIRAFDTSYYLDFLAPERTRLYSYAASASTVTNLRDHADNIAPLLDRFAGISVRDPLTGEAVEDVTGRRPDMVLDPTFLWDFRSETYPDLYPDAPYLALYGWPNREDSLKIRAFADRHGLDVVGVGAHNPICDRDFVGIGPDEWLGLMKGASAVVTDFFHGIIFALIFERPLFAYVSPKKKMKLERILGQAQAGHLLFPSAGDIAGLGLDDLRLPAGYMAGFDPHIASSQAFLKSAIRQAVP